MEITIKSIRKCLVIVFVISLLFSTQALAGQGQPQPEQQPPPPLNPEYTTPYSEWSDHDLYEVYSGGTKDHAIAVAEDGSRVIIFVVASNGYLRYANPTPLAIHNKTVSFHDVYVGDLASKVMNAEEVKVCVKDDTFYVVWKTSDGLFHFFDGGDVTDSYINEPWDDNDITDSSTPNAAGHILCPPIFDSDDIPHIFLTHNGSGLYHYWDDLNNKESITWGNTGFSDQRSCAVAILGKTIFVVYEYMYYGCGMNGAYGENKETLRAKRATISGGGSIGSWTNPIDIASHEGMWQSQSCSPMNSNPILVPNGNDLYLIYSPYKKYNSMELVFSKLDPSTFCNVPYSHGQEKTIPTPTSIPFPPTPAHYSMVANGSDLALVYEYKDANSGDYITNYRYSSNAGNSLQEDTPPLLTRSSITRQPQLVSDSVPDSNNDPDNPSNNLYYNNLYFQYADSAGVYVMVKDATPPGFLLNQIIDPNNQVEITEGGYTNAGTIKINAVTMDNFYFDSSKVYAVINNNSQLINTPTDTVNILGYSEGAPIVVSLKARDKVGNESNLTAPITFYRDITPPTIKTFTQNGTGSKPTFQIDVNNGFSGANLQEVTITINGDERAVEPVNSPTTDDEIWPWPNPLPDGLYNATLTVKDDAGNETSSMISILVQTLEISFKDQDPIIPYANGYTSPNPTVQWEIVLGSGNTITDLGIELDGGPKILFASNELNTTEYSFANLSAGPHTIVVKVRDINNHIASDSINIEVNAWHFTPPTIEKGYLAADNSYIDISFSKGVYTNSNGTGGLVKGDFILDFIKGTNGTATGVSKGSVTKTDGGSLVGGETKVRLNLNVSGLPNGQEKFEIKPDQGNDDIFDAAGNPMAKKQTTGWIYLNDNAVPQVSNVSSSKNNGYYKAGEVIDITVAFSENVSVTGTPRLLLETGNPDRYAYYTSGSGTSTLTFQYTVQSGDTSSDLDYAANNSLELNGGTIKDANNPSNDAVLTLPEPGNTGSLGDNKDLVIDTLAPVISSVDVEGQALTNGGEVTILKDDIYIEATIVEDNLDTATATVTYLHENSVKGPYSIKGTGANFFNLKSGEHSLVINATDLLGHASATFTGTIMINDLATPSLSIEKSGQSTITLNLNGNLGAGECYRIYRSTDNSNWSLLVDNHVNPTHVISNLPGAGSQYYYQARIASADKTVESTPSNSVVTYHYFLDWDINNGNVNAIVYPNITNTSVNELDEISDDIKASFVPANMDVLTVTLGSATHQSIYIDGNGWSVLDSGSVPVNPNDVLSIAVPKDIDWYLVGEVN